jgi:hypothetical protein
MKNKEGVLVNGIRYLSEAKPENYQEQEITSKKYRKKRSKLILKNKKRGSNFFN